MVGNIEQEVANSNLKVMMMRNQSENMGVLAIQACSAVYRKILPGSQIPEMPH